MLVLLQFNWFKKKNGLKFDSFRNLKIKKKEKKKNDNKEVCQDLPA